MLNRLYIVIGIVAILVLAAAFVVPNLIPWGDYRARMQTLATQALGTPVTIRGDIRFALLPAPHLELTDVAVGPPAQPVMSVKSANADFSLMDFLRDRYTMTKLVLDHPVLDLKVLADGTVDSGIHLPRSDAKTALSVANAQIAVGMVRLTDARSNRQYALEGINGDLSIGALNGPVDFTGGGSYGEQHYGIHLTAAALDTAGNSNVSLFVQPDDQHFSVQLDGALATAAALHFTGDLTYRQSPTGPNAGGVVGDLTLASKVDATTGKVVLTNYALIPDENRAVTRLTGNATIDIGAQPDFSATVSSGVLALPPRDATKEQGPQPYELVRMLGELPVVPVPPIPGTVSADVAELNLRSFVVQDVKLLASTDAQGWSIKSLAGQLAGNTKLSLAGDVGAPDGRPSFSGSLSIATDRLDRLATLWRKPAPDNPLFGLSGAFAAKVSLLGQTMALTDADLTLGGTHHALTALVNFGAQRRVDLSGQFTDLSAADSAALLALAPDLQQDASAAVTFPQGAVSLAADSATVFGLDGKGLEIEGKWGNGTIELSKLAAADLGGAAFDLSLALSGTLAAPHIAGDGNIKLAAGGGPALDVLFANLGTPGPVRTLLERSLPADLKAHLDDPKEDGAQGLSLSGKAGAADVTLVAQLSGGLTRALTAPVSASLDADASDAKALTAQLGLGDVSVFPATGPVKLSASADGIPTDSLTTTLSAAGGGDAIDFEGSITPGGLSAIAGSGKLKATLSDASILAAGVGVDSISALPVRGTADLKFATGQSVTLDNLAGSSGPTGFSGKLALNAGDKGAVVSGALTLDAIDVAGLVAAAGGPASLMTSAGKIWPDGPISLGDAPRQTTGSLDIETPSVTLNTAPLLRDAGFTYSWDATHVGVHKLVGKLGDGSITADFGLCCAGPIADKDLTAEVSVKGVPLDALLPPGTAGALGGTLDAAARVNGQGDSIEAMIDGLSGDGSFHLAGVKVQKFDPRVFAQVAAIPDIVNLDPKDLTSRVAAALDEGSFDSAGIDGSISVAGGVLRVPNLAAATPAAKLFGSASVKLADLTLGGGFSLTPVGTVDKAGLVSETTAKVTANLGGTLTAPQRTLDIASMVDAVKVKALEAEVARLEALKAADDARAAASAKASTAAKKEAREDVAAAQLAAQQAARKAAADLAAKQAADAAAKKAAEQAAAADAAAKKAAEQAAAKAAADAAARQAAQQTAPMDLGIPSGSFQ